MARQVVLHGASLRHIVSADDCDSRNLLQGLPSTETSPEMDVQSIVEVGACGVLAKLLVCDGVLSDASTGAVHVLH